MLISTAQMLKQQADYEKSSGSYLLAFSRWHRGASADISKLTTRFSTALARAKWPSELNSDSNLFTINLDLCQWHTSSSSCLIVTGCVAKEVLRLKQCGDENFWRDEFHAAVDNYARALLLLHILLSNSASCDRLINLGAHDSRQLDEQYSESIYAQATLVKQAPAAWSVNAARLGVFRQESPGAHLHIYYPDVATELFASTEKLPSSGLVIITTNESTASLLPDYCSGSKHMMVIAVSNNVGRDILPFCKVICFLVGKLAALKLHTKRGHSYFGELWRKQQLETLSPDADRTAQLFNAFIGQWSFGMASHRRFILSGEKHIYDNSERLNCLHHELTAAIDRPTQWAFCAGTMFWFRPEFFLGFMKLAEIEEAFGTSIGRDGAHEHAVERAFGLVLSDRRLFLTYNDDLVPRVLEFSDDSVQSDEPLTANRHEHKQRRKQQKLVGALSYIRSGPSSFLISGRLARRGSIERRSAYIWHPHFDRLIAESDYVLQGLSPVDNTDFHSFRFDVNLEQSRFYSGELALIDLESMTVVATEAVKPVLFGSCN